jgi:proteasome lid subunit RPN8/RPN11
MNEDSQVKILKPTQGKPPTAEPGKYKCKKFGSVNDDDHLIFVESSILRKIIEYSRTDKRRELGGVLIGNFRVWENRQFITIEEYIEARLGESRSASFKFTHESWHEIQLIKEQKFPDQPLVGWHHTHPTFGIFLSGMDLFIHQGFFNLPWQVALVVDPCNDTLGFFQWKKGAITTCGFYTVSAVDGKAKAATNK